jgi:ketosteroid isomerase-like protein
MKRALSLSLAVAVAGCAAPAPATVAPATPDLPALRASLEKAERDFAAQSAARGVEAWIEVFAEDGMILTPRARVIRGKAAIREVLGPALAESLITWHPIVVDVAPSGDMGFTYGPYEWRSRAKPGEIEAKGSFMTVWRRGPDGVWKVVADMGSADTSK